MAEYYGVLPEYTYTPAKESQPKAVAALQRALALDDTSAEAHAGLAAGLDRQWDWKGAEREYLRALELNPKSTRTRVLYGIHLEFIGKFREAVEQMRAGVRDRAVKRECRR